MPTNESGATRRTMTVRLTLLQWRTIREFALELDTTVQELFVAGINRLMTERDREPIDADSHILPPKKKRKRATA